MKETWRWFGPSDGVTVDHMLQSGVQGVVTGLYDLQPGIVWTPEAIARRQHDIAHMSDGTPSGLAWDVVESLPVSEAIKTQTGDYVSHIANYIQSMEALAAAGIQTICYNFMPVLDWTRTDIAMGLPNGGTCMHFDLVDFAVFDVHLLKREGADQRYDSDIIEQAKERHANMSKDRKAELARTVSAGLPGAATSLSMDDLRAELATYDGIDKDRLRNNLKDFLQAVIPTAERLGLKMACHPDDPPWPVLGLPRIVSTIDDLVWLTEAVDSTANGLTFCSGSLGARADNDLEAIVSRFAQRIHFIHLRNVRRATDQAPTSFFEDAHLDGSTDMIGLLKAILATHPDPQNLPMRPDHGQDILTDLGQNTAPGYPLCGRMKGLAELRGALRALGHIPANAIA
ncbi:MAG: mannonate dehydratase [Paracoccaceae bacterium]